MKIQSKTLYRYLLIRETEGASKTQIKIMSNEPQIYQIPNVK